ncbi:MAG: sigma 54-interacting transcriptional regulator, partial [Bacteroidota bacterium]
LDMASQVKLLRVLQEKTFEVLGSSTPTKVDVRVISATNKNLDAMVQAATFREDLFYRINLISLKLPALHERKSDIPILVQAFVDKLRMLYDRPELRVSKHALNWLEAQRFPGNIRQLKNLVERTALMSLSDKLERQDFERFFTRTASDSQQVGLPGVGEMTLDEMDEQMVRKAMAYHQNKVSQAAASLGITRSALYRRLAKYNIPYDA